MNDIVPLETGTELAAPAKQPAHLFRKPRGRTVEKQAYLEGRYQRLQNEQMQGALRLKEGQTEQHLDQMVDGAICAVHLMDPRDVIEQMLATQLVALQEATMSSFASAGAPGQHPQARERHLNAANRCSRTFAALVDTLNKHRGKGQQKVTVEHVHVHAGGQAIVGTVDQGGGGGQS